MKTKLNTEPILYKISKQITNLQRVNRTGRSMTFDTIKNQQIVWIKKTRKTLEKTIDERRWNGSADDITPWSLHDNAA
jgi:hypothetical protein